MFFVGFAGLWDPWDLLEYALAICWNHDLAKATAKPNYDQWRLAGYPARAAGGRGSYDSGRDHGVMKIAKSQLFLIT